MGGELPPKDNRIARRDEIAIHDDVEISGHLIVGRTFEGCSAIQGHFSDTIFRDCRFVECNFSRSDFDAVAFEKCIFESCNFSTSDIRSTEFVSCSIYGSNFSDGDIKAATFRNSLISGCKFRKQTFASSMIIDCKIQETRFDYSTIINMNFKACTFIKIKLVTCTSLYHFFEECSFVECSMNIDNIGLSFGLTRENLRDIKLVWQRKVQGKRVDISKLLDDLLESLVARRWGVAAAVLAINFSLLPTPVALRIAFASIGATMDAGRPFRSDELRFLAQVVGAIVESGQLPFLSADEGLDLLTPVMAQRPETEGLQQLALAFRDAEFKILSAWNQTWTALDALGSEVLEAEFYFEQRPDVGLLIVLDELHGAKMVEGPSPQRLSWRNGSYYEVVSMTVSTLMMLMVAGGTIARLLDQLISIRAKGGVLFASQLPATIRERALDPSPRMSGELLGIVQSLLLLLKAGHLPIVTSELPALLEKLRAIEVRTDSAASLTHQEGGEAPLENEDRNEAG